MKKSCREIIREILTEAGRNDTELTAKEFSDLLDKTPGFREQAEEEGFAIERPDSKLAQ